MATRVQNEDINLCLNLFCPMSMSREIYTKKKKQTNLNTLLFFLLKNTFGFNLSSDPKYFIYEYFVFWNQHKIWCKIFGALHVTGPYDLAVLEF